MRDYYGRFWCAVWEDLKIVTGKESLLSIIAGLLAIPIGAKWGYVSSVQIHPAIMTTLSVLGIVFVVRLLIALAIAPVRMDQQKQQEHAALKDTYASATKSLNDAHSAQIGEWAKAATDMNGALAECREQLAQKHPSDKVKEQHIRQSLKDFTTEELAALRWLLHNGEVHELDFPRSIPTFHIAMGKASIKTSPQLVISRQATGAERRRSQADTFYRANPEYAESLKDFLFPPV
jgi:hypothetical protein